MNSTHALGVLCTASADLVSFGSITNTDSTSVGDAVGLGEALTLAICGACIVAAIAASSGMEGLVAHRLLRRSQKVAIGGVGNILLVVHNSGLPGLGNATVPTFWFVLHLNNGDERRVFLELFTPPLAPLAPAPSSQEP